jgi:chromatin assembly factor 1 subunit B
MMYRSPDGQAMMLSSADGYCSIVVFDLAELGTVHPIQQHHRQLANIAQSHSHSSSSRPMATSISQQASSRHGTPAPASPSISLSLLRQSPAPPRSEREGSTSSSIAPSHPHQPTSIPPLFVPLGHSSGSAYAGSTASSVTEGVLPTPGEESEPIGLGYGWGKVRTGSESSVSVSGGLGLSNDDPGSLGSGKRSAEEVELPKKKRRVALTHLGDSDAA